MADEGFRFVCTADLHLGRHPSRIPSDVDESSFSTSAVWGRIAQEAIRHDVDAVLIAGDIGDRDNRYFEVFGAFEAGLRDLAEANIPVITVAGNHDAEFLPQIVDDIDSEILHLLGRGGEWGYHCLDGPDGKTARIDGWSFPRQHVTVSPLEDDSIPTTEHDLHLGLVHADLDGSARRYAPVDSASIASAPVDAWILGHIHAPHKAHSGTPIAFYPGSPQPLDPGEPGPHGPWLLSWSPGAGVQIEQLPTASIRFEEVAVDVENIESPADAMPQISDALTTAMTDIADPGDLRLFRPTIRLRGRCAAHAELVGRAPEMASQIVEQEAGIAIRPEQVVVDTKPDLDLETLADASGPIGYLSSVLLSIEAGNGTEATPELLANASDRMRLAQSAGTYAPLKRERGLNDPTDERAIEVIEREARQLLDVLVAQKEGTQ